MIPDHVLSQIRERTNLKDLVGETVELRKVGKRWVGSCPFHDDSSPSFDVSPDKGLYGCFGCGESGDMFDWVMKMRGLEFVDAATYLAERAGVLVDTELPEGFDPAKAEKEWKAHAKKLRARRKREQEKAWAEIAAACAERWEKAGPANPDHPYLKAKGVVGDLPTSWIRQEGDALLIPMKGPVPSAAISSLQTIEPQGDGFKKLFVDGGRTKGCRTTIAVPPLNPQGTVYVAEGWATGWTVHHVTGAPVVVAFSTWGVRSVVPYLAKEYRKATIIVAADNDRWSGSGEHANPGLSAAREVEGGNVKVAVPDFQDLAGQPTDFNDLFVREGEVAVLKWLNPKVAGSARTVPSSAPVADPTPTDETFEYEADGASPPADDDPEELAGWLDTAPFRPVGYDRGTYFYLPRGTGQIAAIPVGSHRENQMLELAPYSWWESHFPAKNGVSWRTAVDAMFRAGQRTGVFRPENLRGRGCWPIETEPDEDGDPQGEGVLLHMGDRLLPPEAKSYVDPESYRDPMGRIYERQPRLAGPSKKKALGLSEAREVLALFRDLLWMEGTSGDLLAGWTVLAPLCGALDWRPHVWITGEAGSGKTYILRDLVGPLLGGLRLYVEGASTEAGIRQRLGSDGLPVVFDESEKADQRSDDRIQSVLALARSASSSGGAEVAKGTVHGKAMAFQVRSMFCLGSISASVRQEADKTRICVLQLNGKSTLDRAVRRAHWEKYSPRMKKVNEKMGRELLARSLSWLRDGRLRETTETFRTAAATVLRDQRAGDQFGTLYAGAWTLMANEPPNAVEAREIVGGEDLSEYVQSQRPAGVRALEVLLQQQERVDTKEGAKTVTVGRLVDAAMGKVAAISESEADVALRDRGLRVDVEGGQYVLMVARNSEWTNKVLRGTPYGDDLHHTLRTLRGVTAGDHPVRFHAGLRSRVTTVPLGLLDGDGDGEGGAGDGATPPG